MKYIIILLTSLFLVSTASAKNASIYCKGDAELWTQVIITSTKDGYTLVYPEGSNIESMIDKLYSSKKFITFGIYSDMGAGLWMINLETFRYSYIQTKDLSWVDAGDFNHDGYVGSCKVVSGDIKQFVEEK
jgi:hypothetical protein